jgi:hypothetical protein
VCAASVAQLPRDCEHLELRFKIQAVARLDLDRRNTLGGQRLHPGQSRRVQLVGRRGARGAHGGKDAAAGARDVLVACAFEALLEFAGTIAGEDEVRMAVDERRGDPATPERACIFGPVIGQG